MSLEIVVVLSIAVISIILFATDKLRVDLVALIIMSVLLLSGYVTPEDGISGFSNTATVTVGAMFIISAALFRTGAINYIGRVLVRLGRRNLVCINIYCFGNRFHICIHKQHCGCGDLYADSPRSCARNQHESFQTINASFVCIDVRGFVYPNRYIDKYSGKLHCRTVWYSRVLNV